MPDRDSHLSPAEVLFWRTHKDAMQNLDKSKMVPLIISTIIELQLLTHPSVQMYFFI